MVKLSLFLKRKILIAAVIFFLVFSGFLIYWYADSHKKENNGNRNEVEIYTAKTDIRQGSIIEEDDIEIKAISQELSDERFIVNKKEIIGSRAVEDIVSGEIISYEILEGSHIKQQTSLKFSSYIPVGKRAISVPVIYYGEQNLINSGDKADLISVYYDSSSEKLVSETILTYKEIVLTGSNNHQYDYDKTGADEVSSNQGLGDTFLDGILSSGGSSEVSASRTNLIITFYLSPAEVEKILNSLQLGPLYISLCPSKRDISSNGSY